MSTLLESIEIETDPRPVASVIWLHGLGADGYDFVPIVEELNLKNVLPLRFIFPHAPIMPVTLNGGYEMRAWYDLRTPDFKTREDEIGLRHSQQAIEQLITYELERGIASKYIVLAGFSQGGAIALLTGLRYPQRLAGILALSTYLPLIDSTANESHIMNANIPIFMAHGLNDPVVPFERGLESKTFLKDLTYPIQWHTYPMGHSVCANELIDIGNWFRQILPA